VNSLLVVLLALLTAAGVLSLAGRALDWIRRRHTPPYTSEVIVLCRDETSFGGVELRRDSAGILLGAVRSLPDDGPPVPMVGDLWIPASNVRAVQIVPHPEAVPPAPLELRTERQWRRQT
jgi:hypothetical protein